MIYCNNILLERTEREAQISVYFDQFFKSLMHKEWDTKGIDKAIASIEKCNAQISKYRNNPNKDNLKNITSKEHISYMLKECFYWGPIAWLAGSATNPVLSIAPMITIIVKFLGTNKNDDGKFYFKLYDNIEQENNKALAWLKKEKERIENGTAKKKKLGKIIACTQEGTIFESIEFI